jgi:anti-sigma factor RsiW
MSSGRNRGTTECYHVQTALSEYLEGGLPPPERQSIETHIAECAACAREAREMTALLRLFHEKIPPREPVLDIWAELGPKVAAHMAEERMSLPDRWRLRTSRFLNNVATGAIMFTRALAMNTEARLRKYIISDPLHLTGEES